MLVTAPDPEGPILMPLICLKNKFMEKKEYGKIIISNISFQTPCASFY